MSIETDPFAVRAEAMLSRVFGGMHHVYSLKKGPFNCCVLYWTCVHRGDLATFDSDILTRLVLGAHEYRLRVELTNGGPRRIKVIVSDRKLRIGDYFSRHPTIEEALRNWNRESPGDPS